MQVVTFFSHTTGVTMGPAVLPPATSLTLPAPVVWATQVAFVMRMWTSALCPRHVVMVPLVATQMAHTTVCAQRAMRVGTVSSTLTTVLLVSTGSCARTFNVRCYRGQYRRRRNPLLCTGLSIVIQPYLLHHINSNNVLFQFHVRMVEHALMGLVITHAYVSMALGASTAR